MVDSVKCFIVFIEEIMYIFSFFSLLTVNNIDLFLNVKLNIKLTEVIFKILTSMFMRGIDH